MWALALTHSCADYILYLFVKSLPNCPASASGMDELESHPFTTVLYDVFALVRIALGALSDRMLQRPGTKLADRRTLIAGLLLFCVILIAPLVDLV